MNTTKRNNFSRLQLEVSTVALVLTVALANAAGADGTSDPKKTSDEEWKKKLTPLQYEVTRKKGTEPAFTGKYWNNHRDGTYKCSNCGAVLFQSSNKFDSGTGWPSFDRAANDNGVQVRKDHGFGMERDEVVCSHCGAHLGHVFDDGPAPTGKRFCINSASLNFNEKSQTATSSQTKANR